MPARSLQVPYQAFLAQNAKHASIVQALPGLQPALQKALAELVLIRLFDDLQDALAGVAYRLACQTSYVDGTMPSLLTNPARTSTGARLLFETHGRTGHKYAKWSRTKFIKQTVKNVLDANEPFVTACDTHSLIISEMQIIRNRIAHKNTGTRTTFDTVLRRYYGGAPRGITPGLLLLASRVTPTPLQTYLTVSRVIVRDCVRA